LGCLFLRKLIEALGQGKRKGGKHQELGGGGGGKKWNIAIMSKEKHGTSWQKIRESIQRGGVERR